MGQEKKAVSIETIEEHLAQQDKESQRMVWLGFATFGVSISLLGIGLWLGSLTSDIVTYIFLIILGIAIMIFARQRVLRIK